MLTVKVKKKTIITSQSITRSFVTIYVNIFTQTDAERERERELIDVTIIIICI